MTLQAWKNSLTTSAVISISAPISKRTFEEMDDSVIIIADDEDEPPLKRYKVEAISHINSLIKQTKAEQANVEYETWNRLQQRRNGLADARRYILDYEIDPMASEFPHTPLSAIHGAITVNKRAIAEAMRKFYDVYKGGMLDDQSEVLLDRYSLLQRRHKPLMETRRYILDLA
jgi:hypothetical protein